MQERGRAQPAIPRVCVPPKKKQQLLPGHPWDLTCPSLYHWMVGSGTAHVSHSSVTVLLTLVLTSVVANSPEGTSRVIKGGTGGERRYGWEEGRAPKCPCSALTNNVECLRVKGRKGHWPHYVGGCGGAQEARGELTHPGPSRCSSSRPPQPRWPQRSSRCPRPLPGRSGSAARGHLGKGGLLRGSLLTAEAVYPRAAHEDILKDLLTTCKPAWRASNALLEPNFQAYKNPCGLTDAAEKLLAITR